MKHHHVALMLLGMLAIVITGLSDYDKTTLSANVPSLPDTSVELSFLIYDGESETEPVHRVTRTVDVRDSQINLDFIPRILAPEGVYFVDILAGDDVISSREPLSRPMEPMATCLEIGNGTDDIIIANPAGNVGIGMTPVYKLDIAGDTKISTNLAVGTNPTTTYKVYGYYSSTNYGGLGRSGYGVYGRGTTYGVYGYTTSNGARGGYFRNASTGTGSQYGVQAYANGATVTGTKHAVWASATGTAATNYGVYATASGGTTNWAGYFIGNVYSSGNVGIGTTGPLSKLSVNGTGNTLYSAYVYQPTTTTSGAAGVYGEAARPGTNTAGFYAYGVRGHVPSGYGHSVGVYGTATGGSGASGRAVGVKGHASGSTNSGGYNHGVWGEIPSGTTGAAVIGVDYNTGSFGGGTTNNYAGYFYGNVNITGNLTVSGTIPNHNHSAADITSGTLPVARGGTGRSTLTSNTVLVGNGTSAVSLLSRSGIDSRSSFPPSSHNHAAADITSGEFDRARVRMMISADTRSTNPNPQDYVPALQADFKQNSVDGLSDGGTYHGVLSFRPYGSSTDFSGGPMHQLGFTHNGNLWMRTSTSTTGWSAWKNLSAGSINYWTDAGSHIYPNTGASNFGIYDNTSSSWGLLYVGSTNTYSVANLSHGTGSNAELAYGNTWGVYGYSGDYGVYGSGGNYGVYGAGGTYGVGVSGALDLYVCTGIRDWGGSYGSAGQFLGYSSGYPYWLTPSGGGGSNWTVSGDNIYRSTGNVGIVTTWPSYKLHVNGDGGQSELSYFNNTYNSGSTGPQSSVYGYLSYGQQGSGYGQGYSRAPVKGAVIWGYAYTFGVAGYRYNDSYNRGGGVFGGADYGYPTPSRWGSLGYRNSGGTLYAVYGSSSYASGSGRPAPPRGGYGSPFDPGGIHIDIGAGAYGDLFGMHTDGNIYGFYSTGGRYASYDHGDRYVTGLDVHLQDVRRDTMAVLYSNTSTTASVQSSGFGKVSSGTVRVAFDETFRNVVSSEVPVVVTVSPIGRRADIYIGEIDESGFTVIDESGASGEVQFTWIAVGRRSGYENPQLPAEVIAYDYNEKISRGLHNDGDTSTDGEGLYFENGDLVVGVHESLIPDPNFIALKEEFSNDPAKRSFSEWESMFGSYGKEIGVSEEEYNRQIKSDQPVEAFFDEYGNQIPPEWIEELKAEGVLMFSHEDAEARRKQAYIDNARARKQAQDHEFQREKEEEHRREIEKHRKDDRRGNETGEKGNIAPGVQPTE